MAGERQLNFVQLWWLGKVESVTRFLQRLVRAQMIFLRAGLKMHKISYCGTLSPRIFDIKIVQLFRKLINGGKIRQTLYT